MSHANTYRHTDTQLCFHDLTGHTHTHTSIVICGCAALIIALSVLLPLQLAEEADVFC